MERERVVSKVAFFDLGQPGDLGKELSDFGTELILLESSSATVSSPWMPRWQELDRIHHITPVIRNREK